MLDTKARKYIDQPIEALARVFERLKWHPDHVTLLAFAVGLCSAGILALGYTWLSVVLLWISGLLDVIDGKLARLTNQSSKSGAFLDMILDRMVEGFFVLGIVVATPEAAISVILFLISVIFNFSTFLAAGALMANTGKKSMHYDVGLMERTETFIFLTLAVVLIDYRVSLIILMVCLIMVTGIIRFIRIYKYLKQI